MREFSFPLRIDATGQLVTHDAHSLQAAAELAGHVISCAQGERPLAPDFGLPNPEIDALSPALVAGAVAYCAPVRVTRVALGELRDGRVNIFIDVEWSNT